MVRAEHAGRAGAIRRRARPDFEVWGRKEDAHCGSPGGHPRSSVGRSSVWGGGDSRFYLPLWLAEQLGAQADGDVANGSDRPSTIRNRCHGPSLLRRSQRWPGGLRADTGEVRDEQTQRPLIASTSCPCFQGSVRRKLGFREDLMSAIREKGIALI